MDEIDQKVKKLNELLELQNHLIQSLKIVTLTIQELAHTP
jgi:hypothetical protein